MAGVINVDSIYDSAGTGAPGFPKGFLQPNAILTVSSANATIATSDSYETILVTTGSSDRTINLPAAASNTGRKFTIKKVDAGTASVIVDPNASETIDELTTHLVPFQYSYITIQSNGTNWHIIASYLRTAQKTMAFTSTPAGWVLTRGVAYAYYDGAVYRFVFNFIANMTTTTSATVDVTGVAFPAAVQTCAARTGGLAAGANGGTVASSSTMAIGMAATNVSFILAGDIELSGKPTSIYL